MQLDSYLSNKFKWLSFVSTWAVVGLHSRTCRWSGVPDWTDKFQIEFCKLFGFAVPVFLVISGFLFVYSYERHGWCELLKRKIMSLYMPACIWLVLMELLVVPIDIYTMHEAINWKAICWAPLLCYEKFGIAYHFWYIRALTCFFLCAPILFWCVTTCRRAWASLLLVSMVLLNLRDVFDVPSCFKIGPCGFQYFWSAVPLFLLGACLARTKRMDDRFRLACLVAAILVAILTWKSVKFEFTFKLSLAAIVWFAYDIINVKWKIPAFPSVLRGAFFVFCAHTIVMKYVSGFGRVALGVSPTAKMFGFLCNISSFWLTFMIAFLVRSKMPRCYAVMAGDR